MPQAELLPTSWTSATVETNGVALHYLRANGGKPPLIALHGLIGSGACLLPIARALEGDFDVILPDSRGHGKSAAPSTGYSYSDLAADVYGLIGQLGLNLPVVLMGHSMGGMTAALVASERRSAISAVILVDPTFLSPERQREVVESDVVDEHRLLLDLEKSELLIRARARSPHRTTEIIEHLVDARLTTSIAAFQVLTPPNPDYRKIIRQIGVPALLIVGDRGVVSMDTARELQSLNPRLACELIPDGGHGLPYDQPEQLGRVIASFLRSLPAID